MSCNDLVKVATVSKYHVYLGRKHPIIYDLFRIKINKALYGANNRLPHFTPSDQISCQMVSNQTWLNSSLNVPAQSSLEYKLI